MSCYEGCEFETVCVEIREFWSRLAKGVYLTSELTAGLKRRSQVAAGTTLTLTSGYG